MAATRYDRKQRTLWSQSGPTPRLIFGAAIIAIVFDQKSIVMMTWCTRSSIAFA